MAAQEAMRDGLYAAIDALSDFAAGRVTKGDAEPLFDADFANGLPAAVVWLGDGEMSNQEIGGGLDEGPVTVWVQIAKPHPTRDETTSRAQWVNDWHALMETVKAAIKAWAETTPIALFDLRFRWRDEPPTWTKDNPAPNGAQAWYSVRAHPIID